VCYSDLDDSNIASILSRWFTGGIVGDEDVTLLGGTATFDTKNVGTNKTVTLTGATLSGTDAGNYSLTGVATTMADITAKSVTGAFTASNNIYDATTSATITSRSITGGIVGAEDVTLLGGTATFDNKNVGTGKTVTGSGFTLGGADAANYSLASVATTTADITALAISGTFTANNKVYDGNNSATVLTRGLIGVLGLDDVSLVGGTATFDTKNVGTNKTVTLTGAARADCQRIGKRSAIGS
jgi:hypothetical protein